MATDETVPSPEISRSTAGDARDADARDADARDDAPGGAAPEPQAAIPSQRGAGRLMGKVALISGGDLPIGRAVAAAFALEGADVALLYFNEHDAAQETMQRVVDAGCETMAVTGDVGLSSFCDDAVSQVVKRFGRIDILVNAASEQHEEPDFARLADDAIERTFRTNIYGQMFLARAALAHMRPGACIVNTSSATAFEGHPGLVDDAAAQGAVVGFTRALALSLAGRGVRVNAVAPGPACPPGAVAPSYLFLASHDAACMSGKILHPDGGTIPTA